MLNIFKKNNFKWPTISFDEIRKRSTILVIDDNDFPYKKLFENDDYKIEKWDDIEYLNRLENNYYDIILLDLQGIGKEQSDDGGLGILKHIKETSPAQIVIAYSNADWSLKHQPFFQKADATLHKHQPYIEFKKVIDDMLKNRFSKDYYYGLLLSNLKNVCDDNKKIEKIFFKAIKKNDSTIFENFIKKYTSNITTINFVLKILSASTTIYKIIGQFSGK